MYNVYIYILYVCVYKYYITYIPFTLYFLVIGSRTVLNPVPRVCPIAPNSPGTAGDRSSRSTQLLVQGGAAPQLLNRLQTH